MIGASLVSWGQTKKDTAKKAPVYKPDINRVYTIEFTGTENDMQLLTLRATKRARRWFGYF